MEIFWKGAWLIFKQDILFLIFFEIQHIYIKQFFLHNIKYNILNITSHFLL